MYGFTSAADAGTKRAFIPSVIARPVRIEHPQLRMQLHRRLCQFDAGVDVAFEVQIREQEIDRRRLLQKRERARRRAGREHLVSLFFQIGFRQDPDLILCEPLAMSNDVASARFRLGRNRSNAAKKSVIPRSLNRQVRGRR